MGWKAIKEHYAIEHLVQVTSNGICIGSGYVHNLITITATGDLALSKIVRRGDGQLGRYIDDMEADLGQLRALIKKPDTFERSIPVYTYEGADIIECACEELDWPNVTHDGRMMYENTFSADRAQVVEWAIADARAGIENWSQIVDERQKDLEQAQAFLRQRHDNLAMLTMREGTPA